MVKLSMRVVIKGVVATVIIAVVLGSIYAVLSAVSRKPIFELKEWRIVAERDISIEFTCTTKDFVEVALIDPTGKVADFTYLHTGATSSSVAMAPVWGPPMAGTYEMVVRYPHYPYEKVAEYAFTFSGPDVSIEEVSLNWEYNEYVQEYFLRSVSVELVNRGDLPARVFVLLENVKTYLGGIPSEWVMFERKTAELEVHWRLADTDTLIIRVEGGEGKVLAERSVPVKVPRLKVTPPLEYGGPK